VEPIRGQNALLASCRAMAHALDPYSAVVTGEDLRRGSGVDEQTGVGIELEENAGVGPLIVRTVLPGGPAQQAGVRPGDEVLEVDGARMKGNSSPQVEVFLNRGARDDGVDQVPVTLRRHSSPDRLKLSLERQRFTPETVLGVARHADHSWEYT